MTRRARRQRTGRIVRTLVRHGLLGLVDQLGLGDRSLSRPPARPGRTAARFGRRLARALDDLGPTFVKLGQILATREDLVPEEIARELAQLQDCAAPFPAAVARERLEHELDAPIQAKFSAFADRPLAAGSIAQIHRARTRAGDDVVVKVRRPGIERTIEADLALLRSLAELAAARMPELARHDPVGFVDEFGRGLRAELDFEREAESLERMRRALGGTADVPRVFGALSGHAVLTMEYVGGGRLLDIASAEHRRQTARRLVACFATQYLRADLFHADPHAGNVLRRHDGALALLDLGSVGAIDRGMRRALLRLAAAAAHRDGVRMARAVLTMVHAPPGLDHVAYARDMGAVLDELVSRPLGELRVADALGRVFALARSHGLRFQPRYFLLFRSAMLMDGVLRALDPDLDPVRETRAHVLRSWYRPRWFPAAASLVALGAWRRVVRVIALPRRRTARALPAPSTRATTAAD